MENQTNSLYEEICKLQELCKRMEEMEMYDSWFNPPATEEEIENWENTNGLLIPESYKEWLRFSNGSQIFNNTARFYNLNEIIKYEKREKYIPEDMVIFGELVGDGELLCFLKTTGKIISLFEGKIEEIASFKEVVNEVIRSGKSILGEDESSRDITAKLMAMLEAQRRGE